MTPQLDVLIAVLGLFLARVDATRPATPEPLTLLVLVSCSLFAFGAF